MEVVIPSARKSAFQNDFPTSSLPRGAMRCACCAYGHASALLAPYQPPLLRALDPHGDRTRPVEDRDVIGHLPEDDDPRLRHAALPIVNDEMVRAPQPE